MFGRLLSKEETNAALMLAFGGTIMLLVANGSAPYRSSVRCREHYPIRSPARAEECTLRCPYRPCL